ncbi:MAG: cupin domain-containing protein [Saprospiraceae bacterium]|nr:cupin domain-containing protein [Saprospiraceae bacterium]
MSDEFFTEERCHILEILNDPDVQSMSLARARIEPGVRTANHTLECEELYYILEGEGLMYLDGKPAGAVQAGDSVLIRNGVAQCIENTGTGDLKILCYCSPQFDPGGYHALPE